MEPQSSNLLPDTWYRADITEAPNMSQPVAWFPLYQTDQDGKLRFWQVGWQPATCELQIRYGFVSGAYQTDVSLITTNKSGRTLAEQAILEARSRYRDKVKAGYNSVASFEPTAKLQPQLANAYRPPDAHGLGSNIGVTQLARGVMVQVKIDGFRACAWSVGVKSTEANSNRTGKATCALIKRTGEPYRWLEKQRAELALLLQYLPTGVGLDMELYTTALSFEELCSAIQTQKQCLPDNAKIQCWIFDICIPGKTSEQRMAMLHNAFTELAKEHTITTLQPVSYRIVHSYQEIDASLEEALQLGYEGLMIRKCAGQGQLTPRQLAETAYKGKRNNNLLKYKRFADEEGIVVGVTQGEGREKGLALFTVTDPRGNTITMRPQGTFAERKRWFEQPEICVGRQYTYKFANLTNYGVPRFPIGLRFRDV